MELRREAQGPAGLLASLSDLQALLGVVYKCYPAAGFMVEAGVLTCYLRSLLGPSSGRFA